MPSCSDGTATVPCWAALPSLNAAVQRYDVAPLAGLHAIVRVTPLASAATWVTAGLPGAGGGGAGAEDVIVNVRAPEVPPPGAGVTTLTGIEPVTARSAEPITACSWPGLTSVVVLAMPFQRTT